MSQLDAALAGVHLTLTFDLEFSRLNCIPGIVGSIVKERKHNRYVILLGTGVT